MYETVSRAFFGVMPSTLIVPAVGGVRPEINFNTVDFPQPDGPRSVTNSPLPTVRFKFESTAAPDAYCLLTPENSTCGATKPLFMPHLPQMEDIKPRPVPRRGRRSVSSVSNPTK